MGRSVLRLSVAVAACTLIVACGRTQRAEPPVATMNVTLARADAAIGMPIEMTYRFVVASNAPKLTEDEMVFVHFVDVDGELMWTDDHHPPVPASQWAPGQTIEYSRTMFVPKFPYTGETRVIAGVYSPKTGVRLPLAGATQGQNEYQVAKFTLHPQTDNLYVVFKDGWHETEIAEEQTGVEWQWSKKSATLAFRNPMRDATFYLQCDQPVQELGKDQHVDLRIGNAVIDSFDLPPGKRELRKVALTPGQMGTGETVEIAVDVDKTFVPATISSLKNTDARELGVRVFRAYVQAK